MDQVAPTGTWNIICNARPGPGGGGEPCNVREVTCSSQVVVKREMIDKVNLLTGWTNLAGIQSTYSTWIGSQSKQTCLD